MTILIFEGINEITVYFDDLIIAKRNQTVHRDILKKVIEKAKKWNIKFNSKKIQYMTDKG